MRTGKPGLPVYKLMQQISSAKLRAASCPLTMLFKDRRFSHQQLSQFGRTHTSHLQTGQSGPPFLTKINVELQKLVGHQTWNMVVPGSSPILTRIIYNYPPKGRWIVVDIYQETKRRGTYPPLFTDPVGDSCFSIYQIRWIKNAASLIATISSSETFTKRHNIFRSVRKTVNIQGCSKLQEPIKTRQNCYSLIW